MISGSSERRWFAHALHAGNMSENGFYGGEGESALHDHDEKVKVDPGTPPSLTWKRKLSTEENSLSEFSLSLKEIIGMAPIGYRLWRHLRQEKSDHGEVFLDPFTKRHTSSCHGVPVGVLEALEEAAEVNLCVGNYFLGSVKISQSWQTNFLYAFQTPEGWDFEGRYRSLGYMRPLAIWAMQWALTQHKIPRQEMKAEIKEESVIRQHTGFKRVAHLLKLSDEADSRSLFQEALLTRAVFTDMEAALSTYSFLPDDCNESHFMFDLKKSRDLNAFRRIANFVWRVWFCHTFWN
ncbi:UNVERIFIED_CONTAM: Non-lysosomal glucosylceramidase [Sesamum indicum]